MRKDLPGSSKHQSDLHYMHRKNAAILTKQSPYIRAVIWGFLLFLLLLVYWMYVSKIDKLTRGIGRVVPSLETQYIQSYDGGIVDKIFVKNGDTVQRGDPIVSIDDSDFKSKYMGSKMDSVALKAKSMRLYAEANNKSFEINVSNDEKLLKKLYFEKKLYDDRKKTLEKKIESLEEKIKGKYVELKSVRQEHKTLLKQLELSKESVGISTRMLAQKVVSRLQYNEQLKQLNSVEGSIANKQSQILRIESEIKVLKKEIQYATLSFASSSREELEEINSKLEKLQESKKIDKGRIKRALIVSPVNGVVKQMHYNTLRGVIKPSDVIAEIVPTKEHLIIDTKIDPSKIAFIYIGQKANIRFSAYDFAIYGMLKGEVISISADTSIDQYSKKNYYSVKIKTYKNYLGKDKEHLPIKIGMTAIVDIINSKQTILQYLLSPIIKATQNTQSNS